MNFHETIVDITVDFSANFSLSNVDVINAGPQVVSIEVQAEYPLEAYYCKPDNTVDTPPSFHQGSAVQMCIKVAVRFVCFAPAI